MTLIHTKYMVLTYHSSSCTCEVSSLPKFDWVCDRYGLYVRLWGLELSVPRQLV